MSSESVHPYLKRRHGAYTLERLGGLSGWAVYRLRSGRGEAVLKTAVSPNEARLYLRRAGVGIPLLEAYGQSEEGAWLLLEWIPERMPRARWLADPEVLDLLRRVHGFRQPRDWPEAFRPRWTKALTAHALGRLPASTREAARARLEALRRLCLPLFRPSRLVSGDPNPKNWGLRADGSPVLFDWERFTSASPLIDLAISVPGLGSLEDFARAAEVYAHLSGRPVKKSTPLRLAAAKAWTAVELLSALRGDEHAELANRLTAALPGWLEAVLPEPPPL